MNVTDVRIERVPADDPRVTPVIAVHVATMDASTPDPTACHRLDLSGLLAANVVFFGAFAASDDASEADAADTALGICAYAHFPDPAGDWGEVKSMHVLAEHRGRGIAGRILDAVEQAARENGATVLRLETGADFDAAIGLYTARGFEPTGPFGSYPDHPFSRFFEKRLGPSG